MSDRRTMTGAWFGSYSYDVPGEAAVSFIANLEEGDGGALSGTISEPNTVGESSERLHAIVSGARDEGTVGFAKTYDGASDAMHRVDYGGTIDAEGTRVTGSWTMAGFAGRFEMTRSQPHEEEAERIAEIAEAPGAAAPDPVPAGVGA